MNDHQLWQAVFVTAKLASFTTLLLLVFGVPLAWWMARSRLWLVDFIGAVIVLPLVLPSKKFYFPLHHHGILLRQAIDNKAAQRFFLS